MSDPEVIKFRPDPSQYAWTFGGAAPVARVKPPVILVVFTTILVKAWRNRGPRRA